MILIDVADRLAKMPKQRNENNEERALSLATHTSTNEPKRSTLFEILFFLLGLILKLTCLAMVKIRHHNVASTPPGESIRLHSAHEPVRTDWSQYIKPILSSQSISLASRIDRSTGSYLT